MTNNKYKQAIDKYNKEAEKLLKDLIQVVEVDLRQACEKWGIDCFPGADIAFQFFEGSKREQNYHASSYPGDAESLMEYLEPDLDDALCTPLLLRPAWKGIYLDDSMEDILVNRMDYEWVAIKTVNQCLEEPVDEIEIVTHVDLEDSKYDYFGMVFRELAEEVVSRYKQDWELGHKLLKCLPLIK